MCNGGAIQIETCYYDFGALMTCFNSFCVMLQPREQNILFWIVGSFVCDISFCWGVYIPGLVEIYGLSMGKRTWMFIRGGKSVIPLTANPPNGWGEVAARAFM